MPRKVTEGLILYDIEELSELLGVQERTLRQFLRGGRIRGRKLARKWYVTQQALEEYFNQPEPDSDEDEEEEEDELATSS